MGCVKDSEDTILLITEVTSKITICSAHLGFGADPILENNRASLRAEPGKFEITESGSEQSRAKTNRAAPSRESNHTKLLVHILFLQVYFGSRKWLVSKIFSKPLS
jgi:hypothetical protein